MTLSPLQADGLDAALDDYLTLTGTTQPPGPDLDMLARELLEVLRDGRADDAACGRAQITASQCLGDLRSRIAELRHEQETLAGMSARNREVADRMQEKLSAGLSHSREAWQSFTIARKLVGRQGNQLLKNLGQEPLEKLISRKLDEMLYSPTTLELTQAMQSLLNQASSLFDKSQHQIRQIGELVEAIYSRFSALPGQTSQPPRPSPDLAAYRQSLIALTEATSEFCRRPMNLITDKASLVKKFGLEVVLPLRSLFARLQADTEDWLKEPCNGLQGGLQDNKVELEKHEEDIAKIRDYLSTLDSRLAEIEAELARLVPQETAVARILAILDQP